MGIGGQPVSGVARPIQCDDWSMERVKRWMAAGSIAVLCAACSTGANPHSPNGSPAETGTAGLRAAATAWSHTFLTGTLADIHDMQGASCRTGNHVSPTVAEGYLRATRAAMEHDVGVPLSSIRITGVLVRNVTTSTGDAEVQYALPASVVGNDNWVSYAYQDERWKVTNCNAPIGGESSGIVRSTPSQAPGPMTPGP